LLLHFIRLDHHHAVGHGFGFEHIDACQHGAFGEWMVFGTGGVLLKLRLDLGGNGQRQRGARYGKQEGSHGASIYAPRASVCQA